MKRKPISASLRWQVFARDGFRCRYCGAQAGEPGVTLHADHVVSVADGGTNAIDNLVAACQRCNGGKAARSLGSTPGSADATAYAKGQAVSLEDQAAAISDVIAAKEALGVEVVNMICDAYGVDSIMISPAEQARFVTLVQTHGGAQVSDWLCQAAGRGVRQTDSLRYVHGIIRNIRRQQEGD